MIISLSGIQPQKFTYDAGDDNQLGAAIIYDLDTLPANDDAVTASATLKGLKVNGDADVDAILPHLQNVSLVEIEFPTFMDGRGFSLATLIKRSGFKGELRATGPLIPDQAWHLSRTGFDTIVLDNPDRRDAFIKSLDRYQIHYQVTVSSNETVIAARHAGRGQDRIAS